MRIGEKLRDTRSPKESLYIGDTYVNILKVGRVFLKLLANEARGGYSSTFTELIQIYMFYNICEKRYNFTNLGSI